MRFALLLPLVTVATALAYPLVPVAVLLCDANGRLPWAFRWLETHDALGWQGPLTEPATRKTTERFGRKVGLIRWLWRNKAYTLRYWLRARVTDDMARTFSGDDVPKRWGYSHWFGQIGPYWEWNPRLGFGAVHLHLRIGWKMKPYFVGLPSLTAGMFTGVSIRSDDWDDYEG